MSEKFTSRNHYNPCFWTALWNEAYFAKFCSGQERDTHARHQSVYSLNLCANRILETKVEAIHYHKDLGVAEITPASWKDFCVRRGLAERNGLPAEESELGSGLFLDFEATLTGVETAAKYSCLMRAAQIGGLESLEHKGFLIAMLMIHAMRSYEFMSILIGEMDSAGVEKWEYFVELKRAWSNRKELMRAVVVPMLGEWTFWRSDNHVFPLCDSPVMMLAEWLAVQPARFAFLPPPSILPSISPANSNGHNYHSVYGAVLTRDFLHFCARIILVTVLILNPAS